MVSPLIIPGMNSCFCSSVPAARMAGAPLPAPPTATPTRANSSSTMYCSMRLPPCPPYSLGQLMPIQLRSADLANQFAVVDATPAFFGGFQFAEDVIGDVLKR